MQVSVTRTWIVAKVVISRLGGSVLALRRSHTAPHQPLKWDLPGGLIEFDEDPVAGTIRETLEETGLTITGLKPLLVRSSHPYGRYEVSIYFHAQSPGENVELSYEHDQFKWVSPSEFADLDGHQDYIDAVAAYAQLPKAQ